MSKLKECWVEVAMRDCICEVCAYLRDGSGCILTVVISFIGKYLDVRISTWSIGLWII